MLGVSNYHEFVKEKKKNPVPPRRLYGDMLPFAGVVRAREVSDQTKAKNMTVERAMERTLKSYYIEKRQHIAQLDAEAQAVYKKALKRFKFLKIAQRKRKLLMREKELQEKREAVVAAKAATSVPFARRSSVIEAAKVASTAGSFGFRRGSDREQSDLSPLESEEKGRDSKMKIETKPADRVPASPISMVANAQMVLPVSGNNNKRPKELPPLALKPKLSNNATNAATAPQRRGVPMLVPIPEDDGHSKSGSVMSKSSPSSSPDFHCRKKKKKKKEQREPPIVEFVEPLPPIKQIPKQIEDIEQTVEAKEDKLKPLVFKNKIEVLPLIPKVSKYIDWKRTPNGNFRPFDMVFTEPEVKFFSYGPIIQKKQQLRAVSSNYETVVSTKIPKFFEKSPTEEFDDSSSPY